MPDLLGYVSKIRIGTGEEVDINDPDAVQKSEFLDLFYPVGSYYETSNSSFDPNTAWGGTWVKEAEGKVHVSAGSTYTINSTGGAATRSYTPAGSVNNTTLSASQMPYHRHSVDALNTGTANIAHTHDLSNHTHFAYNCQNSYVWIPQLGGNAMYALAVWSNGSYTDKPSTNTSGGMSAHATDHKHSLAAHNTNYAGGSNGTTQPHNHGFTGTQATIDVRQPYVAVNRWHRTA